MIVAAAASSAVAAAAQSLEAEQAVLGAVLLDADVAWSKLEAVALRASDFIDETHGQIWAVLQAMRRAGVAVDVVTAHAAVAESAAGANGVTLAYLNTLAGSVPTAQNAGRYAEIVVERGRRRRVATAAAALKTAAASPTLSAEGFRTQFAELLDELDRLRSVRADAAPAALPVEWAADLGEDAEMPAQLVEGVLTMAGLGAMVGQSNAGKSYLASSLAVALAQGEPWLGRRTNGPCPVLYVAAEGAASIRARWQAERRHSGRAHGPLALVAQSLSLLEPSEDADAIIGTAAAMRAREGRAVGLIVVDTVARVMAGADENSGQDMGRLIAAVDRVREATGAHVLLVHHMGKDAGRGARGHSSLRAALDTEIEVTVDEATKTHYAKVTKQRDLPSRGERLGFKLIPVELGADQWGQPVTACAVEPSDVGLATPAPRRLTAAQQAVLGYLTGRERGARRSDIALALEAQGTPRSTVYRAVNELLLSGMVIDVTGVIYMPRQE